MAFIHRKIGSFPAVISQAIRSRSNIFHRAFSSKNSLVPRPDAATIAKSMTAKQLANPWKAVKDPKGSSLVYYWNTATNETTGLGARKPEHWVELDDPSGRTSLTYWWNPETKETTSLGAPRPSSARLPATISGTPIILHQPPMSGGRQFMQSVAIGFSFTLGIVLVRLMIG